MSLDGDSIKLPGFYTVNEFDVVQTFNPNKLTPSGIDLSLSIDQDALIDADTSLNQIDVDDDDEKFQVSSSA